MNNLNKRNLTSMYSRWLYYAKAWRTDKKIVVIESDDWGSIRTSKKKLMTPYYKTVMICRNLHTLWMH